MDVVSVEKSEEGLVIVLLLCCDELNFVGPNIPVKYLTDKIGSLSDVEFTIKRKKVLLSDKKTSFS
jgi:hypothetical protein